MLTPSFDQQCCHIEILDADIHQAGRSPNGFIDCKVSEVTLQSSLPKFILKSLESKDSSHGQEYLKAGGSEFVSRFSSQGRERVISGTQNHGSAQARRLDRATPKRKWINRPDKRKPNNVSKSSQTIYADIVKVGPSDLDGRRWCEFCEKEFPSTGSLKGHLLSSHTRVLWCHTCLGPVTSESEMRQHVVDHHGDLPNVCFVCGKSFKSLSSLQRHTKAHEGCRGTVCEICGQTFSRNEYHKEHMRIHTGERPFKCEVCQKKFSKSSNLKTHMVVHSPPEEGHLCSFCLKVFRRQDKLKEHMMRHLKIKRFVCKLCSKAYSEKRDLTKHINKLHVLG